MKNSKMTDEELAEYCDNTDFGDEMEAARERGELYCLGELGNGSIWDKIKRMDELSQRRFGNIPEKIVSIGLPVSVVEEYKKIAKSRRKPYQRLVNEVLVAGLGKFQRQGNLN